MPGATPNARVHFHTLGCPKNDADTRALRRRLEAAGAAVVEDPSDATHVVVNTCGFIQDAKEESIAAILSTCADFPNARIVVMGCLVERYREELRAGIPEVSDWLGVADEDLFEAVVEMIAGGRTIDGVGRAENSANASSYAYLKIADGCDERCTFCAIPGFKGPYFSVPLDDILREADACLSEGASELVLVGQDTTRWENDGVDLMGLIDELASDRRTRRIRVMYLQPARLDARFLEFMASHEKLCAYLDVPFQHAHREVLRRMGRQGDGESYLGLLREARELMPSVATRSTFIVGFPGETKAQFESLLDFVEEAGFDYGGAFVYSPEEGTAAAQLSPVVGRTEAQRRLNVLSQAVIETGMSRREEMLGAEVEVVIDSVGGDEVIEGVTAVGRTEGQAPEVDGVTYLQADPAEDVAAGNMVRVRITEVLGCDLLGEIVAT